jgi:hypothetical protein
MSDLIVPDAPDAPVGPEPYVAPEPDPEPAPAPEVPAVEVDDPDRDTFDRPYVEKLRQEAAQYRTRAREYEEAFEGYDPETKAAWLQFAQLQYRAAQGDQDALAQLEEFYGDDEEEAPEEESDFPQFKSKAEFDEYNRQIAREEYERLTSVREQHQAQVAAVKQVRATAEGMGYKFGTPEYRAVLGFANEPDIISSDAPLEAAHQRMEAWKQQIIQEYLAGKSGQADTMIAAPSGNGGASAPDLSTLPWTHEMSEAQQNQAVRRSVAERFRANQNG